MTGLDSVGWVRRWDAQQAVYVQDRERRFTVMAAFLEVLAKPDATVLDLAAGPGSAGIAMLDRLPDLSVVALDTDPVLIALGQHAHGDRLHWARADLRDPTWTAALDRPIDAVISTTALHWLPPHHLARLHRQLADLLPPGGVFLNGDLLPLPAGLTRIRAATAEIDRRRQKAALTGEVDSWAQWWDAVRAEPELADAFTERVRLWPNRADHEAAGLRFHEAALVEAGFAEVGLIWQDLEERLLLAVR